MRNGHFTSSSAYKLCVAGKQEHGFGVGAITYITEKRFEKQIKRALFVKKDTRATLWGNFMEQRVYELLPTEYQLIGQSNDAAIFHSIIENWSGKPDVKAKDLVGDIKCPEPKSFCELVKNLTAGYDSFKKEHPDYFWQLISNAILLDVSNIELIVYLPYFNELEAIAEMAEEYSEPDQYKYRFIAECARNSPYELAWQSNDSEMSNLYRFKFEAKQEDKDFLTERIQKANDLLCKQ